MTKKEARIRLITKREELMHKYMFEEAEVLTMAIEALQADTVEVVWCKDCRYANECHKSVQYTRNAANTVTIGYSPIEWCSRGERRE